MRIISRLAFVLLIASAILLAGCDWHFGGGNPPSGYSSDDWVTCKHGPATTTEKYSDCVNTLGEVLGHANGPAATSTPYPPQATLTPYPARPTLTPYPTAPPPATATTAPSAPVPTATTIQARPPTAVPTTAAAPAAPTQASQPTQPVTVAGGEGYAVAVDDLGGGWFRIRTALNNDHCAWSTNFKVFVKSGTAKITFPHCLEMRVELNGEMDLWMRPEETGYATSNTTGQGLAAWPTGTGQYAVLQKDGQWTPFMPLTNDPAGVDLPLNGGERMITLKGNGGNIAIPIGEIRNNIRPKY